MRDHKSKQPKKAKHLRSNLLIALTAHWSLTLLEQLTYGPLVLLRHCGLITVAAGTQSFDGDTEGRNRWWVVIVLDVFLRNASWLGLYVGSPISLGGLGAVCGSCAAQGVPKGHWFGGIQSFATIAQIQNFPHGVLLWRQLHLQRHLHSGNLWLSLLVASLGGCRILKGMHGHHRLQSHRLSGVQMLKIVQV